MPNGSLAPDFIMPLTHAVKGKRVLDLGAGNLALSCQLLKLGAAHIIAVEKERTFFNGRTPAIDNLDFVEKYFDVFMEEKEAKGWTWDIAFLSWPVNWPVEGLLSLLQASPRIIVLSKNTDYSACGWLGLWQYLTHRVIDLSVPDEHNWLHFYGPLLKKGGVRGSSELTPEEEATLDPARVHAYRLPGEPLLFR